MWRLQGICNFERLEEVKIHEQQSELDKVCVFVLATYYQLLSIEPKRNYGF